MTMTAPSTFTSFTDLPVELRLRIWKFACSQQRNIDVSFRPADPITHVGGYVSSVTSTGVSLTTYTKPPSTLHVNRELRLEALKYYSHVDFSSPGWGREPNRSQLYINWRIDRLCFSSLISLLINEQSWYGVGSFFAAMIVRRICLKNGLRYLGWNIADIGSFRRVENYNSRVYHSMKAARSLPWNHQIDEFVVFYNQGAENSNSRGEIVEFGSAPLILRERKTWLDGIHFNTARNSFEVGNVTQGVGALFLDQLDRFERRWWTDHEFLGQETTMLAFEQGREARKAVNRVRLFYDIERVEVTRSLSCRLLSNFLACLPDGARITILIMLARIYLLWTCLVICHGFIRTRLPSTFMIPIELNKARLLAYGCYGYLENKFKGV
ncbi:hypothetical protein BofuT4_P117420.1 [Botrytis cinerea T4]|uniref:2EXR domain-containing protein n=1 Tax=Botryotinia fuckeliana (strain T4) TaxID=999810 RepID=G2Y0M7_BOTF4|nr:hypothetical protein BofuT4_P117420.1 [Botrytis cinerea T4]